MNRNDNNSPLYEDLSDIPKFDDDIRSDYKPESRSTASAYRRNTADERRSSSSTRKTQQNKRRGKSSGKRPAKLKIGALAGKSKSAFSSRVYPDGYTGRRNTGRSSRENRAAIIRKQRTTLIIFALIVIAALILLIIGISAVIKGSKTPETPSNDQTSVTSQVQETTAITITPEPMATPAPERDITGLEITDYDGMITVGDSAYEFYKFDSNATSTAISAINNGDHKISVPMYTLLIPTSIDIMLPLSLLEQYADETSDQQKAESYFLSQLEDTITPVYCYDLLKAHCNENLFFNSDSRINGLTAYYIYTAWCKEKGVAPITLDKCTKKEYGDFFGNIANRTGIYLKSDTVEVYEAPMKFSYSYKDDDGSTQEGSVYVDVSGYGPLYKYQAFCGGSHSYSEITNSSRTDGSSCLIIVDSNGFALAPFIASHYSKTYIIDYRYYSGGAMSLANELGVSDIVIAASTSLTAYSSLADSLTSVMN